MNQKIVSFSSFVKSSVFLMIEIFFQPGKYFLKRSFKWSDSLSGNCMSKLTIKSPLRLTSLGLGKPLPTMRLTVLGCTTSSCKLTTMRSPPNKGISARAPHRAWKIKRKKYLSITLYNLFSRNSFFVCGWWPKANFFEVVFHKRKTKQEKLNLCVRTHAVVTTETKIEFSKIIFRVEFLRVMWSLFGMRPPNGRF